MKIEKGGLENKIEARTRHERLLFIYAKYKTGTYDVYVSKGMTKDERGLEVYGTGSVVMDGPFGILTTSSKKGVITLKKAQGNNMIGLLNRKQLSKIVPFDFEHFKTSRSMLTFTELSKHSNKYWKMDKSKIQLKDNNRGTVLCPKHLSFNSGYCYFEIHILKLRGYFQFGFCADKYLRKTENEDFDVYPEQTYDTWFLTE
eukprot:UN23275